MNRRHAYGLRLYPALLSVILLSLSVISCKSIRTAGYENGHRYVDLGLSVKWATMNVGAVAPQDTGYYYAWGETEPKDIYSWMAYRFRTDGESEKDSVYSKYVTNSDYGTVDDKTTLEPEDDVAHIRWGGRWHIPTSDDLEELMDEDNCTWTWTTMKGVAGYKIQSRKKGYRRHYVFLPAVGLRYFPAIPEDSFSHAYWSGTLFDNNWGCVTFLLPSDYSWGGVLRFAGLPVRPVFSDKASKLY